MATCDVAVVGAGPYGLSVAAHLSARRRDPVALGLSAVTAAGLGYLIVQSRRDQHVAEDALTEALGVDYAEQLDALPTPADLATPWRRLVNPFRMRNPAVRGERDIAFGEAGRRNHLDV